MQVWIRTVYVVIAINLCAVICGYAQRVTISGTVYDSLSLSPLQYVTVINQATNNGTTTDENGMFKLSASAGDTILFTMLAYRRKLRAIRAGENAMVVFLREYAFTLSPVTIYSSYKPLGSEQWSNYFEAPKILHNPAGPGSGYVVETFGPGVSIGGLITKMFKSEKEKRKVDAVREQARQSETYVSFIVSDETKRYFQDTFSMTDDEYNDFIEKFNIAHPEAVYIQTRDEILKVMVAFAATKK